MPGIFPRLPVVATVEQAIKLVARHFPGLLVAYALPWLAVELAVIALQQLFAANLTAANFHTWILAAVEAPIMAVFAAAALRMALLGERPLKEFEWWFNATTMRVGLVLLLMYLSMVALVYVNLLAWVYSGLCLSLTANGWSFGDSSWLTFVSRWSLSLAKLVAIALIYGQAAIAISRGRFDWRETLRLLQLRPIRLIGVVLLSAVAVYGLQLFWVRIVPWLPRPAFADHAGWRDLLLPALELRLRWFPYDFLRDSFMVMALAATYRRLAPGGVTHAA